MSCEDNRRILIIDDQAAIHDDFRKILSAREDQEDLSQLEHALFGEIPRQERNLYFEIDSAYQGQEGLAYVNRARLEGRPYSTAFVDMRMPPGWDGVETATRLWEVCPELQIVICTAYTDYSWQEMRQQLGVADRWVILKKPFDNIEAFQLACALTEKWNLNRKASLKLAELEAMVDDRTRELRVAHERLVHEAEERLRMEEQLQQVRKLESVGQLAAGVAHHFNNVLQIIMGNTGLLHEGGNLTEDQIEALEDIERSSRRANILIGQLLAFSRRQLMRPRLIDFNAEVAETLSRLSSEFDEGVTLNFAAGPDVPNIPVDPDMLSQVLSIMAGNAREAMTEGGEISISTDLLTVDGAKTTRPMDVRAGPYVCLSVADTGAGMDAATAKRLFEPFFTTKDIGKGSGLGLATAYGIVKQHRGWIDVSTQVNAGTTFRVYWPAASADVKLPQNY